MIIDGLISRVVLSLRLVCYFLYKEFKEGVMREFEKVIENHFADKNI